MGFDLCLPVLSVLHYGRRHQCRQQDLVTSGIFWTGNGDYEGKPVISPAKRAGLHEPENIIDDCYIRCKGFLLYRMGIRIDGRGAAVFVVPME